MNSTIWVATSIIVLLSILPFIRNQHWVFRVPDFVRPQLLFLQLLTLIATIIWWKDVSYPILILFALLICIGYNCYIFIRFTKFWRSNKYEISVQHSKNVKIISVNVYQFNTEYHRLVDMIRKEKPDIFMTMESNQDWENALQELKNEYPNFKEIALENTYGMHFYTKLKVHDIQVHYFVADDLPSIEAELETEDGYRFIFFGVHPPPPSPTEEETSKERDGDLLCVAKRAKKQKLPVVITGDFNTVAWSRVSVLFKKASGLIDARYGRGYLATFHAKYWFFRIPLDLLYHSADVFIDDLKILPSICSDHFPMCCTFYIDKHNDEQIEDVKTLDQEEKEEVEELIEEGKEEESENRSNS
ncbi:MULTISPECIES: endonuclease/exonuclease/phosphatase family protein [Sphingobacterium]|uniref:Endonuclease/exonuclease/phosphatase family protein n=1 Tax=Sphingobacterium litopenaei TaxID=2763500 RepID=A0ABR7YHJ6_9SPHI|nr:MULTISPECIES: endonuclease/exonuclease/phosphatase family protein [Sphingobacterium]MBD1430741.1 endonuclease/exonuclease/phosphatase family protein [Sphingobacterium litopenaei]NGM72592.1 endonuclease/exonuclease/phosphatase family protein [Sphingobacterium sp. SGL-16]